MSTARNMEWIKELIRKLLVLIVTMCFAFVLTFTILFNLLQTTLLEPENWYTVIEETQLADRSRGIITNLLVRYALSSGQVGEYLEDYPPQVWQGIAEVILPTPWVHEKMIISVDKFMDWLLFSEDKLPQVTLDLSPVIDNLHGPQGSLAVLPLMQGIPPCGKDTRQIDFMSEALMSCLPDERDLTSYGIFISGFVADNMPERVSLASIQSAGLIHEDVYSLFNKVRGSLLVMESAITFGFRLGIFLLCLFALLQSINWQRVIQTLHWPFYSAFCLSGLLLAAWYLFVRFGLGLYITVGLPTFTLENQVLLADIIRSFSRIMVVEWLRWSLALLGLGLLIQVLGFGGKRVQRFIKTRSTPQEATRPRLRKQFR